MRYRCLSVACLLAVAGPSFADDGYTSVTGGAINFAHSKQIQMVSERVVIHMRDRDASIDATFHFRNLGPATTAQMGFPEVTEHGATISSLRSEVDGHSVRVKRHWIHRIDPNAEGDDYEAVWIKRVSFAAGQSRTVQVHYDANNSFLESGTNWQEYVLTTGSTWSGNIGKCELVVDYSRVRSRYGIAPMLVRATGQYRDVKLYPASWSHVAPNTVATTLENVKPDFDLQVHVLPGFWKFKINGKTIPLEDVLFSTAESWPQRSGNQIFINRFSITALFADQAFSGGDQTAEFVKNGFEFRSGKVIPLKHKPISRIAGVEGDSVEFVDLREVVEGLGGTCKFEPSTGYVLIDIPKT